MNNFLLMALVVVMIAVVLTLAVGIISMTRGGPFNQKYGQRLMRMRVFLQGVALILFAMILLSK
jgi:hypothetical protein